MKKFIVTNKQLTDFVKNKQAEKVFYEIVADLHINHKNLNESVSLMKLNKNVIDNYRRKNLVTPKVEEMLIQHGILDENKQII